MRAVYFEEFNGHVCVHEVPDPDPSDFGAVIEVKATGQCRSDWFGWAGHDSGIALPHVPGHEFSGVISAIGRGVTRVKVGDRVAVPFVAGCGTCSFCLAGNAQVCPLQTQPGFTHWGSFADFVAINFIDFNAIALPEAISFDTAASLGCRFATSFRGVVGRAKVQEGEWVAIFGCGGVGLSAIMIAKAFGARVIAVDISDTSLEHAKRAGAEITINSQSSDPIERIIELTSGGAHVGIDALGSPLTVKQSILSLRRRGRHVQIGLISSSGETPISVARTIAYELDVLGSHGMSAKDYPHMLAMIEQGTLRPDLLLSRVIDLESAAKELPTLEDRSAHGITVIHP